MSQPEIAVEGGSVVAVLVGIALALATVAVGAWIAVAAYRGYRRSRDRSVLLLAVGIGLASTAHTSVRVALSTAEASLLHVSVVATAVQFTGLVFVLYAVYGDPEEGVARVAAGAVTGGILVSLAPLLLVEADAVSRTVAMTGANGVTAVLGAFISVQAYRGYRRYDRRPMRLLAVGIGLLTVGSFAALNVPPVSMAASDAVRIGIVLAVELAGLLSIAASLRVE